MHPKYHIFVGFLFSLILFYFLDISLLNVSIFFLASFLLDFDHYLYFIIKEKSFSLKKAYLSFKEKEKAFKKIPREKKKEYSSGIYIFHGIEIIILFLVLSLFVKECIFVALGILLHLILDWIQKIFSVGYHPKKFSIIYDCLTFKKFKEINYLNK